jgi:small GTP-binding protein
MGLNTTPRGQRLHIALFGRRNVGKSSLINALTGQEIAIVSQVPGTTTDPVAKAMEILPIGPVMLIDTAGLDDTGELGTLRVKKSLEVFSKTDMVLLLIDPGSGVGSYEEDIIRMARSTNIPVITVVNKLDLYPDLSGYKWIKGLPLPWVGVSALWARGLIS